jgi:WhiB family transcriptional regulator, redox-sensing transcriptional regulator
MATKWSEAACRGVNVRVFFADTRLSLEERTVADDQAKRICMPCPIRGQCLDVAIKNQEQGVWGGTSEAERKELE